MAPRRRAEASPPWSEERLRAVERRSFAFKKMQDEANARLSPQEILAKIRTRSTGGAANNPKVVPAQDDQDTHVPRAQDFGDKNTILRQYSTVNTFKHSELSRATNRMRSLGTASNQQHLRYKEIVYLLRRRKAYLSLRNEVWRMGKAELSKAAARRCWGRTPDKVAKLLDGERLSLEEVYSLWPAPFDQLATQWDETYLREFPEVVDRDVWGQPEWTSFYTAYSRDFRAAPSAHVKRLMRWQSKPNYTREIPYSGNLPAHLNAALLALGVEAPRSTWSHSSKAPREPPRQAGRTAKEQKLAGNRPGSTAAAATTARFKNKGLQRTVAASGPNSCKKSPLKGPTSEASHRLPVLTAQYKRPQKTTGSKASFQRPSQKGLNAFKMRAVGKKERCKGFSRYKEKGVKPINGRKGRRVLAKERFSAKRKPKKTRTTRPGGIQRPAAGGPLQVASPHGGGPLSPISVPESPTSSPLEKGIPEAPLWWDPSRPYRLPDQCSKAGLGELSR